MGLKLLAVGDLHLGRRPGGLPDWLELERRVLGPAAALERLVETAIAEGVDAVAFAGDLVEQEDDFFEAYQELRGAVCRLVDAGIRVLGVAGNHDVEVLPALADALPGFELLGRGGRWQQTGLQSPDGVEVVVHGYSFPQRHVTVNPLGGHHFERDSRPTIGLLHCDLDQSGSRYAPVARRDLVEAGLDAFLLGHIHRPDPLTLDNRIGYLGSVTPLRPTETGRHGPWLLTFERAGLRAIEQWPLAPLRWQAIDIDLSDLNDASEAQGRLLEILRQQSETSLDPGFGRPILGLRVGFSGRSDDRLALEKRLEADQLVLRHPDDNSLVFVRERVYRLLPRLDLNQLAKRRDPLGLLVQRLQLLDRPPADRERQALLEGARGRRRSLLGQPPWNRLPDESLADADLEMLLRSILLEAIDTLAAQLRENTA